MEVTSKEFLQGIYGNCDRKTKSNPMCGDCIHKHVCVYYGMLDKSLSVPITENCPYYIKNN